jgi:adenylate cyclase class 2
MKTEIEVKILEINVQNIISKLNQIGAIRIVDKNQRRNIYLFNPPKENSWIRLRDTGESITLAIKEISNDGIEGTQELEFNVDNFEIADQFLNKLGYSSVAYQENKRSSYKLGNVEIEIDSWPQIPPYLEIEGNTIKEVENVVKILGFKITDTTSISTDKVYLKYGIDLKSIKELKF